MTTDLLPLFMPGTPEIFLFLYSIVLLLLGVFQKQRSPSAVYKMSLIGLGLCLFMSVLIPVHSQVSFNGMFLTNYFTQMFKILVIGTVILVLILSEKHLTPHGLYRFEYPILVLFVTVGMMGMISSNDLMAMFISLELQSLGLYILLALNRQDVHATESALKYFVLGALTTAFLLFGISLMYGYTGSIEFQTIAAVLQSSEHLSVGFITSLIMIVTALGFKLSLAPFHMWTPDVYEGSPTPVTTFMASAPKIAAVGLLLILFMHVLGGMSVLWKNLMVGLALLSIVIGAFAALFQKNLKRLLAYSTISHMGFVMLGLLNGPSNDLENVIVYITLYALMTIGAFAFLLAIRRQGHYLQNIQDLIGLSKDNPSLALCFSILLFSMAGVPPFSGFFAKLGILKTALHGGYMIAVVIAVLASVVSAAYYLQVIRAMYFDQPIGGTHSLKIDRQIPTSTLSILWLMTLISVFYLVTPAFTDKILSEMTQFLLLKG